MRNLPAKIPRLRQSWKRTKKNSWRWVPGFWKFHPTGFFRLLDWTSSFQMRSFPKNWRKIILFGEKRRKSPFTWKQQHLEKSLHFAVLQRKMGTDWQRFKIRHLHVARGVDSHSRDEVHLTQCQQPAFATRFFQRLSLSLSTAFAHPNEKVYFGPDRQKLLFRWTKRCRVGHLEVWLFKTHQFRRFIFNDFQYDFGSKEKSRRKGTKWGKKSGFKRRFDFCILQKQPSHFSQRQTFFQPRSAFRFR